MAAALAAMDDAGRREMIGLAAPSQLAVVPVWLGIIVIFGLPADIDAGETLLRALSVPANLVILIVTMAAVQYATGVVRPSKYMTAANSAFLKP